MKKQKQNYVDGFVLVVPKSKVAAYKKMAQEGKKVWMKHGALDYKECMIDDPNPPMVAFTFAQMTKLKKGETVWFSYITYKSRAHRDQVNKKVMAEMEKKYDSKNTPPMPFDMKRMACAGFKVEVSA
jgi:uncharacterized protein YbaA (DUF1428 family)